MRYWKPFSIVTVLSTMVGAAVASCGGDDTTNASAGDASPDVSRDSSVADTPSSDVGISDTTQGGEAAVDAASGVTVHVSYGGSKTGVLAVGLFTQPGPPAYSVRSPSPVTKFPADIVVPNVAAGSYGAGVYIDIRNDSFFGPAKDDPVGNANVAVPASGVAEVTVTVTDPDGGSDGGDAGDAADSG